MPVDEPGLAHLRNLFVDREFWGTGLASELHGAAIVAARERGFAQMRLFTPARHGLAHGASTSARAGCRRARSSTRPSRTS